MSTMSLGSPCGPSPTFSIIHCPFLLMLILLPWWVKLKTDEAHLPSSYCTLKCAASLPISCSPPFVCVCVCVCFFSFLLCPHFLDLPAFLMFLSDPSFFLSLSLPLLYFKIFVNFLNWKCSRLVQTIKVSKGYWGECALPPVSQFPSLKNSLSACYISFQKYVTHIQTNREICSLFLLRWQHMTHNVLNLAFCNISLSWDHSPSVYEASFWRLSHNSTLLWAMNYFTSLRLMNIQMVCSLWHY